MLSVVEVFATLQGEGSLAGSPAIFVRLAGCNLWSGHKETRGNGRGDCAGWCDTVFHTGDRQRVTDLCDRIETEITSAGISEPLIVFTGGEPMLQLKRPSGAEILLAMREKGYRTSLETNGTIGLGDRAGLFDHVTVSPKGLRGEPGIGHVVQRNGTDLKVVYPTPMNDTELLDLAPGFQHCFIQPMDRGDNGEAAIPGAIALANRLGWRVSVQTHKYLGLP